LYRYENSIVRSQYGKDRISYTSSNPRFYRLNREGFSSANDEEYDWIMVPRIPHSSANISPSASSNLRKCKQAHQKRLNAQRAKQSENYF
jgi:hypothetical protein